MKDELEKLEALYQELESVSAQSESHQYFSWRNTIQIESERIKKSFIKEAFGLRKEKMVELYIQYHQSAIVQIIDKIVDSLEPEHIGEIHKLSSTEDKVDSLKFLYQNLESLLTFIEKHFSKYFNQHAKSPESYRFIVHRDLKEKLPEVRYTLEKKGVDKRLLSIVLTPLDSFIQGVREEEVSYRKIIYLKELFAELNELCKSRLTETRLDFKLYLSLGYVNFNSHKFFKHCIREITQAVQDEETLTKQIEKLAWLLKIINQIQCKPGFIFNEKLRSIKDQLSDWITEEMYFFEKRQQLAINFPVGTDEPVQKDFKLKLDITVSQLAFLLRGLKEIGIIKNNNILEVIRFIAGIVQTKHTDNISWDSLRSKFYNIDESAKDGVREITLNLFNYVRKVSK